MSESPEVYVKGGRTRLVRNARDRVAAEFEGFKPAAESVEGADYRGLQATAKSLGIPANQSKGDLEAAIANFEAEGGAVNDSDASSALGQTPETDDTESGTPSDKVLIK